METSRYIRMNESVGQIQVEFVESLNRLFWKIEIRHRILESNPGRLGHGYGSYFSREIGMVVFINYARTISKWWICTSFPGFNSVSSSGNRIIPVGNNNLHCEPPANYVPNTNEGKVPLLTHPFIYELFSLKCLTIIIAYSYYWPTDTIFDFYLEFFGCAWPKFEKTLFT